MKAAELTIEASGEATCGRAECAWCGASLGERPEVQGVTHGICELCKVKLVGGADLDEFRAKRVRLNILCYKHGRLDAVLDKAERLTDMQLKACMEHQRHLGREVAFELVG